MKNRVITSVCCIIVLLICSSCANTTDVNETNVTGSDETTEYAAGTSPITEDLDTMDSTADISDTANATDENSATEEKTTDEKLMDKEKYKVVFYGSDGCTILSETVVEENGNAFPPDAPQKNGCEFLGWEGDYINITEDRSVRAVYSDETNVFVFSPVAADNGQIKLILKLCGNVKTCGFDISIAYDSSVLELVSCDDQLDLDIVYNQLGDSILVNYSSANDKEKAKDIIELTYRIINPDADYAKITIDMTSIKEICGSFVEDCDYSLINYFFKI